MIRLETEVIHHPQGSEGWLRERAGVFTGSNFHLAKDRLSSGPRVGDWSAAALKEARKLAFERATNHLLDDTKFRTPHMDRGNRLEDSARKRHAELIDVFEIAQCGLVRTTDKKFGASVDGLIDADGGAEYKAFTDPDKVFEVLTQNNTDMVMAQVQGGMLLTGRSWWHFGLYHPALSQLGCDLNIIEIERDEAYIEELWEAMKSFDALIEDLRSQIIEAKPAPLKYPCLAGGAQAAPNENILF